MSLTISDIGAVLKKVIIPEVYDLIKTESVLRAKTRKNVGIRITNNNIYISARTGRHSGIYHVAEGTAPFAGKSKYQQPYTSMKYGFGTIELTDQSIEAALNSGDTKAVAAILATEIQGIKDDIRADDNRIMHGDGTGKLCLTNGTGANSTALIIDSNPAGLDANEYLAEGMYIQIGSTAANTALISALVSTTGATLSAGKTWANNDVITKASDDEPMGLAGIIDDGDNVATIQAMTRASYPIFNAFTYDTDTALTENAMIRTYLKTKRRATGKGEKVWLMGSDLYADYGSLLVSTKRTKDTREVLKGGWMGLDFMDGVGVMLDDDCWYGYAQFVDFGALTIAEMSEPMKWLEGDAHGGILIRSASNRTVWEGTLKHYWNLIGLNFKALARMSNQDS